MMLRSMRSRPRQRSTRHRSRNPRIPPPILLPLLPTHLTHNLFFRSFRRIRRLLRDLQPSAFAILLRISIAHPIPQIRRGAMRQRQLRIIADAGPRAVVFPVPLEDRGVLGVRVAVPGPAAGFGEGRGDAELGEFGGGDALCACGGGRGRGGGLGRWSIAAGGC